MVAHSEYKLSTVTAIGSGRRRGEGSGEWKELSGKNKKWKDDGRREWGVGRTEWRKQVEGGRKDGVGRTDGLMKMMIIQLWVDSLVPTLYKNCNDATLHHYIRCFRA